MTLSGRGLVFTGFGPFWFKSSPEKAWWLGVIWRDYAGLVSILPVSAKRRKRAGRPFLPATESGKGQKAKGADRDQACWSLASDHPEGSGGAEGGLD